MACHLCSTNPLPEPMPPWWGHQMETFSALLALCAGNLPVTGEFPAQRPVTLSFDVFFYLCLNKRFSKQSWGWWFETPSRPLWRHCNNTVVSKTIGEIWIKTQTFLFKKMHFKMLSEDCQPWWSDPNEVTLFPTEIPNTTQTKQSHIQNQQYNRTWKKIWQYFSNNW